MISLKRLYKQILKEQVPQQAAAMGQQVQATPQAPMAGGQDALAAPQIGSLNQVVSFPRKQFTVSLFSADKKIIFTPIKGTIRPSGMRQIIKQIESVYSVINVNDMEGGVIEVVFSPAEDFGAIYDFIQKKAKENN